MASKWSGFTGSRRHSCLAGQAIMETLEPRMLLSGTVNVAIVNGNVVINGDDANNSITITGPITANQFVTITGNAGTTVTGLSSIPVATKIKSAVINMFGGDDTVVADHLNMSEPIFVYGGDGNNTFVGQNSTVGSVVVVNGAATTGSTVTLNNSIIAGTVSITNGSGGSSTSIVNGSRIKGKVTITNGLAGAGANTVAIVDSILVNAVQIDNQDGVTSETFSQAYIFGAVKVTNRAGNDSLQYVQSTINGAITINTGSGGSNFVASGSNLNRGVAYTAGAGADAISIVNTSIAAKVVASLGADAGSLTMSAATFGKAFSISNTSGGLTGGGSGIRVGGALTVNAGDGDEDLDLNTLTVKGKATFTSGSGNDSLTLGQINITGKLAIAGGTGANTVTLSYVNSKALAYLGGSGVDTLILEAVTATGLTTDLKDGNNVLNINDSTIIGNTLIATGAGNDTVNFNTAGSNQLIFAKAVKVLLGDGNDTLTLGVTDEPATRVSIYGKVYFDGQGGTNTFTRYWWSYNSFSAKILNMVIV